MSKIKALLFDLDGTLIDSEFFYFECWNDFLKDYGVQLTFNDWLMNYAGHPMPKNAAKLISKYHIAAELADVISQREKLSVELFKTKDVNLMPFVIEFIEYFYAKGLTLAIVTASQRGDVETIFKRNGLAKYFSLFITRNEVSKSKPDPESYHVCVEQLGLQKDECLVFEDTINGVKSAMAAGITCYAVQNNIRAHQKLKVADQLFLNLAHAKAFMLENDIIGT